MTDDGDQVETSQAEIADIVQAALAITFQLWISEDTDLVCSLYPLANGAFAHRYNLDGLASKERCIVESWAVDYFKKRSTDGMALLLVVDDDGSTVESDWDGFAEGRLKAPNRAPEIIGVCPPLEVQYSGSFTDLNGCRLITNPISKDGHTGESRG